MRRLRAHHGVRIALAFLVVLTAWLCAGRASGSAGGSGVVTAVEGHAAERHRPMVDHVRSTVLEDRSAPRPCVKKSLAVAQTVRGEISAASATHVIAGTVGDPVPCPPPGRCPPAESAGRPPPVSLSALSVLRV